MCDHVYMMWLFAVTQ